MADEYLNNWQNAVSDQSDFSKSAYSEAIPDLAYSIGASKEIAGLQARGAMDQAMLARGLATRRGQFNNLEDSYIDQAKGWNSEARKDAAAGAASADVAQKFNDANLQSSRAAMRVGVNPNSGKFAAMSTQMGMEQAKAQAQAMNKARQDVDAVADAKMKTAIGFGSNLNRESAQAAQVAGYTGNAALAAASQPIKDRLNFAGGVSNIYQNEINNNKDLWGINNLTAEQRARLDSQAATNQARSDSNLWGAIGTIAGSQTGQNWIDKGIGWLAGL